MKKNNIIFLLVFLLLWEAVHRVLELPSFIIPSPKGIFEALVEHKDKIFWVHLPTTLLEIVLGVIFSLLISFFISWLMIKSEKLREIIYPILVVSQTIPIIALSPIFIMWFGYGIMPKVIITVLISFFPLCINLYEGLASVEEEYIDLIKTFQGNKRDLFWKLRVPFAMPFFFSGLKIAVSVSIIGAIIGEWLGGKTGLGVFSRYMANNLKADAVFATIFVLAFLGVALLKIVEKIEKKYIY